MTARDVARSAADVLVASPRFLTAPLYRHWHLRWRATDAEVASTMPGDEIVPDPRPTPPAPSRLTRRLRRYRAGPGSAAGDAGCQLAQVRARMARLALSQTLLERALRCRHPDYQSCPHFQAMVLARLDRVHLAEALDHH